MQVLIAEDDPVCRRLLEGTLRKWDYELVSVDDGRSAWAVLSSPQAPRLAVLDWGIPGMDGLELCRRVRAQSPPGAPYTYIILLTARGERADLITGMDAGADDYIIKPFDAGELRVRLHAAVRILDLQAQLLASREALRTQATHDPLTGLWNRGAILDALSREQARAHRFNTLLGVGLADLDHFKRVNDTYGHKAGDAVLVAAAQRMSASLRAYDILGRYGGEEFLFIAPECGGHDVIEVAQRLRLAVCTTPFEVGGQSFLVSASIGVTIVPPSANAQVEEIVAQADSAMYAAKGNGRNQVQAACSLVGLGA
jgi:diguanylate cyclase (GGDEF)-like protein